MCGIVVAHGWTREDPLREMMGKLRHRGPDGEGDFRINGTHFGHVRLAILDAPGGRQPMVNERANLMVSFNGEIYNHLLLKAELEKNHRFRTRSDTEVLIHGFEEFGEDLLPRLDGMFAAAWAGPEGLLLARDPYGIKPLYFGERSGAFLAASELKAFPPMDSLQALPAGHAWSPGGAPWRYALPFPPRPVLASESLADSLARLRQCLTRSVVKRLMSDVPVGVYLSGGLDSSLVAALMRPHVVNLHTFTAGMEGAPDLEAARVVAKNLGTQHHELIYTAAEVRDALPEVIGALESFDAPLVRSAVPMYFVSRLAAQHVKVVLSGEGADEIFAGYPYLERLQGGPALKEELAGMVERLQDTNLQRADRMSMAFGLEARVPFLDQALVRLASRLPAEWLEPRPDRPEKWILREACRGLLPPEIMERKKMKFSEGAGSASVAAELARRSISPAVFQAEREVAHNLMLRSVEELYYYRIWREQMPSHLSPALVGRTRDWTAAT
ncbi:MAG: asparagine synthetase B [Spirochaetes bacterium]|nr:asparagine synthetase B [Spirochaetota bacterium]